MKKIAFVTDVPFWRNAAGCDLRVNQVVKFLSREAQVSLFYIGKIPLKDRKRDCFGLFADVYEVVFWKQQAKFLIKDFVIRFVPFLRPVLKKLRKPGSLKSRESDTVKSFLKNAINKNQYDVLWVEYVWLTYLFDLVEKPVLKVVDTHDVQYDRCESFEKIGLKYDFQISKDEELHALGKADCVLAINNRDYKTLSSSLRNEVIEYPYFHSEKWAQESRSCEGVNRVAFVGSAIDFNIKALDWFLTNVWPVIVRQCPTSELHVYGKVSSFCKKGTSVFAHGFVEKYEDIYKNNRIFVNPILMGGGLKIKCVEALMCGKALVTTSVGAQGLENGINKAFLVADEANLFAQHVIDLLNSEQKCECLENEAKLFAEELEKAETIAEQKIRSLLE